MKLYERQTMDLRWLTPGSWPGVLQQKWIVTDGEPYVGPSCAITDMPNGIHPQYGLFLFGKGSYDSVWQRLKEEWRDIPVVSDGSLL